MGDTLSVAVGLASHSLAMEIVEIGDLLLYNEDLDDAPAKALVA